MFCKQGNSDTTTTNNVDISLLGGCLCAFVLTFSITSPFDLGVRNSYKHIPLKYYTSPRTSNTVVTALLKRCDQSNANSS